MIILFPKFPTIIFWRHTYWNVLVELMNDRNGRGKKAFGISIQPMCNIAHTCLNWELFFHCLCCAIFSNFIWDRYVLQPWYMIFACAIEQITAAVGNSVAHSIISYWNICICACNTKQWTGVKTKTLNELVVFVIFRRWIFFSLIVHDGLEVELETCIFDIPNGLPRLISPIS